MFFIIFYFFFFFIKVRLIKIEISYKITFIIIEKKSFLLYLKNFFFNFPNIFATFIIFYY